MRHIVPQAVSSVNFSKRVKVQMRVHVSLPHGDCCTYRSGVQCRYAGYAGNACFSKDPRLHALRGTLPTGRVSASLASGESIGCGEPLVTAGGTDSFALGVSRVSAVKEPPADAGGSDRGVIR